MKVGQIVNIYRQPHDKDFEGVATLVKLVQKCRTQVEPFETWIVKFNDDDEPVLRNIYFKPLRTPSIASSLARAPENRNLLIFMAAAGLSEDWADPSGHGVKAYITGKKLNNEIGTSELSGKHKANNEILVHLECTGAEIVLNLNTVLALASSYIRQQCNMAAEATEKNA